MFNNLTIYQCTQAVPAVRRAIQSRLENRPHKAPGAHDETYSGWVSPLGQDAETLTYAANNAMMFCLRTDIKTVPSGAVKLMVAEKVRQLEEAKEEVTPVDKRLFKEEIIEAALPNTLASPTWTWAYLDLNLGMMFVGASEDGADSFISILNKTLDALPVKLLKLGGVEPCDKFTEWLKNPEAMGEAFELGDSCSLKQAKEGGTAVINISHEELEGEDIAAMLEAGKQCCRIGLSHERASFAITAKLGLRRFKLSEDAESEEDEGESPLDNTVFRFTSTVNAVRAVLADLEPLLGGWPVQEVLDLHDEEDAEDAA